MLFSVSIPGRKQYWRSRRHQLTEEILTAIIDNYDNYEMKLLLEFSMSGEARSNESQRTRHATDAFVQGRWRDNGMPLEEQ